jgi:transcriptional regulator with PAS, ATPase and Fis domain
MIEGFKTQLWRMLRGKDISLVILFNKDGEILCTKGRCIVGKDLFSGEGFSKSSISKALKCKKQVTMENILMDTVDSELSKSVIHLHIKSLFIFPIAKGYYLYLDSGTLTQFTKVDREVFKVLGEILGCISTCIRKNEENIGGIAGTSRAIDKIRDLVLKYSILASSVLLTGETGVGKSHIAELIHWYSGREGKFVTINTPGIPKDLFESEIFGYKKGAFSDARLDKPGFVNEAEGGTLFFDEISEVPFSFQTKLLRFIETKRFSCLGDPTEKIANIRIIAATNKDLKQLIKEKKFRTDLYYRLNILAINIPPLRERKQDIKALVLEKQHLLENKKLRANGWEALYNYDWPGNIRELFTVLTRLGIHGDEFITPEVILQFINQDENQSIPDGSDHLAQSIYYRIKTGKTFWEAAWKPFINRDFDRKTIKLFLQEAFLKNQNNFKKLIADLNLESRDYHSFMTLMHKYKIDPRVS